MSYEDIYGKAALPTAYVERWAKKDYVNSHKASLGQVGEKQKPGCTHEWGTVSQALALTENGKDFHETETLSVAETNFNECLGEKRPEVVQPLRAYADWYHQEASNRSVLTAAHFKIDSFKAGRASEAQLWSLAESLLEVERSELYNPEAIGITDLQPQRRWFITHYAHIQNLLQREPVLRRACVVCRWLEQVHRERHSTPKLHGQDDVVMRQLLLSYIRGGELDKAVDASIAYKDGSYACTLAAAHLHTTYEPWFTQTALVPLFGEYANGDTDLSWCGNESRLQSLALFFDHSLMYRFSQTNIEQELDAVIGAVLSGNIEVLEAAFESEPNWRDTIWCYLRCSLIIAFTKTCINAGILVEGNYAAYIERYTTTQEDWYECFAKKLILGLHQRIEAQNFLSHVELEEQLEIRFILQILSLGEESYTGCNWFNILPDINNSRSVRLITHMQFLLNTAYLESISPYDIQASIGDSLAFSMAQYSKSLALLPNFHFEDALRVIVAMSKRLCNPQHRAEVYAAFLHAVRNVEFEHEEISSVEIEEQEARLIRMLVESDPDNTTRVTVQKLLNQQITTDTLLTHNKVAENILWEAMQAYSMEDYMQILNKGLDACISFWLSSSQTELNAITDVSRILMQRVLPHLPQEYRSGYPCPGIGEEEKSFMPSEDDVHSKMYHLLEPVRVPVSVQRCREAFFWSAFSEARGLSNEHAKVCTALGAARATSQVGNPDRTLLFRLSQDEVGLMTRLITQTERAVYVGGALVHHSRESLTAVVWLVQVCVEDVTLSLLNNDNKSTGLGLMQSVFKFVDDLNEAGYLHPSLLPQKNASDLYKSVRTMRVAYGRRVHRKHIEQVLRQTETRHFSKVAVGL